MNLHRRLCIATLAFVALIASAFVAQARELEDNGSFIVRLSAEQINALTNGFTWIIRNHIQGGVTHTYFRSDGVRFTRNGGEVELLGWSVKDVGHRCVHFGDRTRCGLIANIDGQLTICMQIQPMGDCNYSVLERRNGDPFQLEALHQAQAPRP